MVYKITNAIVNRAKKLHKQGGYSLRVTVFTQIVAQGYYYFFTQKQG